SRTDHRRTMTTPFDNARAAVDSRVSGLDSSPGRAFEMTSSGTVRNALDLAREPSAQRDRYQGVEQFLTARRLVEAGVGCVTLSIGGWDTHGSNFITLRQQLPQVDRGVANLVRDLCDRGMDKDVVTVMWGEFGRTPRINGSQGGRDHWSPCMGALVAGGGLKMGQAVGASSERGEYPRDRSCTPSQVLSTLYRAMGIDPAMTFPNNNGRPMYVLDDREPIAELL